MRNELTELTCINYTGIKSPLLYNRFTFKSGLYYINISRSEQSAYFIRNMLSDGK